jgi:redox-sensitive bicupin YhaK (pirin superfamily)
MQLSLSLLTTALTYFFDGGFTHRDSIGIRQSYGSYYEKHSQWLFTGAGILHEEMYNFFTKSLAPMRQELYQIWINVPAACKMKNPNIKLLGGADETPLIDNGNGSKTLVLAGSYQGQTGAAPLQSDMMILQVSLEPEASWNCDLPASFRTAFLYVRKGALQSEHGESIPTHHVVYYDDSSRRDERVTLQASEQGADFIFLAGEPINEPCAAEGSMVMNTADEINTAYADYQMGLFGKPWDHKLTDEEWRKHVASNPSRYR